MDVSKELTFKGHAEGAGMYLESELGTGVGLQLEESKLGDFIEEDILWVAV